ncbi:response regulator transcription factor [Sinimarinibacterium sp. CAU 1509]|uniref:response regulator transcription factor n=1 Tax=Sinimarinibacterium sp. CAU 1509 TaxID=2562283 RepID=UPI0010ACB0F6|nr:response regulator transcription factor [Sinimarinibacterium sp. CAU 1509]TJY63215.1 response regulator transcription factor [Sinimarinibacterium sp. CAU 1509]
MQVLIIEDDRDIAGGIREYLAEQGHTAELAHDGVSGLRKASAGGFDAIVLDRMLPKLEGIELCRKLRAEGSATPVLMLTALGTVDDKVEGFEAGADDYLVKPFALAELKVRLEALVRRAGGEHAHQHLQVADLSYDPQTLQAIRQNTALTLNPTTRRLLEHLMRASPRVVPRGELEHLLWGNKVPNDDILRIHMHALRSAIDKPFESKLLHTIHGVGYRLGPDAT